MKTYTNEDIMCAKTLAFEAEVREDLDLNDVNLGDKSRSLSGHKEKWIMIWLREEKHLGKMRDKRKAVHDNYVQKHGQRGVRKLSTEDEQTLNSTLSKIDAQIKDQEEVVRYLKLVTEIFRDHGFTIKNSIDINKMEFS